MYKFDERLLTVARKRFHNVFVDVDDGMRFVGHDEDGFFEGDRVRVYQTDWEYEEAMIAKSNEELRKIIFDSLSDDEALNVVLYGMFYA